MKGSSFTYSIFTRVCPSIYARTVYTPFDKRTLHVKEILLCFNCRDTLKRSKTFAQPSQDCLDLFSHLYKLVSPSVGMSVGPCVGQTRVEFLRNGIFGLMLNKTASETQIYAIKAPLDNLGTHHIYLRIGIGVVVGISCP